MFKKIILSIALLGSLVAFAHEGHDDAPGALKANHGGTVKAGHEINLEYVVAGTEVKLFPISHDGKELAATDVTIKATTKLPKGKVEAAKIENKDGAFVTQVDFKGGYRVEMNVTADTKGKKSTFKFQVEK